MRLVVSISKMFLMFCYFLFAWSAQEIRAECPMVVSREQWRAEKPRRLNFLSSPIDLIVIQHTVTESCSTDQKCAEVVREIQNTHVKESFLWDIGPSFLVGGNGRLYTGRGWHYTPIHTPGYNNQSIVIAFIGNFINNEPSQKALDAVKNLIQCGIEERLLTPSHKLVCHSQLIPTESPGKNLFTKIMSWYDWTADVSEIISKVDKQPNQALDLEPKADYGLILTSPKQIDFLSTIRDVIAASISNMSKAARAVLDTVETISAEANKASGLFIQSVISELKKLSDRVGAAFNILPGIPIIQQCANPIQEKANTLYKNTESKSKECSKQLVRKVEDVLNALRIMASNALDNTITIADSTTNCTELNYGIQSSTKTCLNSITEQLENDFHEFETERNIKLKTINDLMRTLPAEQDLCAKQNLQQAGAETVKMVADISSCATKNFVPTFGNFVGGNGR